MIVILRQRVAQNGKSFLFSVNSCNFALFRTFGNDFTSATLKAVCKMFKAVCATFKAVCDNV